MTPTVHREGPYKFRFYSAEHNEPPHVHVWRDRNRAKFWLNPVQIVRNKGYAQHELNRIETIVRNNREKLLEAWYDHFSH